LFFFLFVFILLVFSCARQKKYPVGVRFKEETLTRKGNYGDNWCQTWASGGNIYTMLDDRNGWWGSKVKDKGLPGWSGSMCLKISGDKNFTGKE